MPTLLSELGFNQFQVKPLTADQQIVNTNQNFPDIGISGQKIESLTVGKLRAGSLNVDDYIQSTGFVSGSTGWQIKGDGTAEFVGITLSGGTLKYGKCFVKGTKILMYDGSLKNVEDIKIGELIMGDDSTPRKVLNLGGGEEEMFKVIFKNGDYFICNKSHILSLKSTTIRTKNYRKTIDNKRVSYKSDYNHGIVKNLTIEEYLKTNKNFKNVFKGYRTSVVFKEHSLPINPYFLGLWLGDGTSASVSITSADEEIIEFLKWYAQYLGMVCRVKNLPHNKAKYISITTGYRGNNFKESLQRKLRELNLIENKHIPVVYKVNSRENRLKLLAGLIDSDGYVNNRSLSFCNKNETLIENVKFVALSLGFSVGKKRIKVVDGKRYFDINISGDFSELPLLVKRKKIVKNSKNKKDSSLSSFKIESLGFGKYYGFEIDGNRLFVIDNFIVTHNTSFTDNTNAGYILCSSGIYIGAAADATYLKYTLATGAFDFVGTISSRSTATLASAINSSGNLVNDIVNVRLDSSAKNILSDFAFGSTDYSGALKCGTITWNTTTGAITGGSGGVFHKGGLVFSNAGVATITLDATTGNATFAGVLSAPTGNIGGWTISASTLYSGNIVLDSSIPQIRLGPTSGDEKVLLAPKELTGYAKDGTTIIWRFLQESRANNIMTLWKYDATPAYGNALSMFDYSTDVTATYDSRTFKYLGDATTQFDVTNPAGTTFRYTYDGTGTDPLITLAIFALNVSNVIIDAATNFAAGNKGQFTVTGAGANYFEVTNVAGVVESNKTLGVGYGLSKSTAGNAGKTAAIIETSWENFANGLYVHSYCGHKTGSLILGTNHGGQLDGGVGSFINYGTTGIALVSKQENTLNTTNCGYFYNNGTGSGVFIDQNGNAIGLEIDSESTTQATINTTAAIGDTYDFIRFKHDGNAKGYLGAARVDAVNEDVCLVLGSYYLWIDSTNTTRFKSSLPTYDTDGDILGNDADPSFISSIFPDVAVYYTDDFTNLPVVRSSSAPTVLRIYRGIIDNQAEKYIDGVRQGIPPLTIWAAADLFRGAIVRKGYYYANLWDNGASVGKIYRCLTTDDITNAAKWTEITISGYTLTANNFLIGYGNDKYWILVNAVTFKYFTESGTTWTYGGDVSVAGAAYSGASRVNEKGIYCDYAGAPYIQTANFTGTTNGQKQVNQIAITAAQMMVSKNNLYTITVDQVGNQTGYGKIFGM